MFVVFKFVNTKKKLEIRNIESITNEDHSPFAILVENIKFQRRKRQMSERSTLVDIKASGGLTFAYDDFRTANE